MESSTDKPNRRARLIPIEDELQQQRFASLPEKVYVNLIYTTNVFQARTEQLLKSYDLTPQQYNILRILRGQHGRPISLLEVKGRMLDRNPDVSRIVDRMVRKGHVDRQICPTDRRQADLTITAAGLNLLTLIDPHIQLGFETLESLKSTDLERLNALLDRARAGHSLSNARRTLARHAGRGAESDDAHTDEHDAEGPETDAPENDSDMAPSEAQAMPQAASPNAGDTPDIGVFRL